MTPHLDAGPCLVQRRTPIGPNETSEDLEPRLAELGVVAVIEAIDLLATGRAHHVAISQDSSKATKAPRLKKEDGLINWLRTAAEIHNQVAALSTLAQNVHVFAPQ